MLYSLARLVLAPMFLLRGFHTFRHPEDLSSKIAAAGIPEPELAAKVDGAVLAAGGAALGLGIRPRLAAALLIATVIPTMLLGHAFWKEETEAGRKTQRGHFFRHLALIGGLLLVLTHRKAKRNNG